MTLLISPSSRDFHMSRQRLEEAVRSDTSLYRRWWRDHGNIGLTTSIFWLSMPNIAPEKSEHFPARCLIQPDRRILLDTESQPDQTLRRKRIEALKRRTQKRTRIVLACSSALVAAILILAIRVNLQASSLLLEV